MILLKKALLNAAEANIFRHLYVYNFGIFFVSMEWAEMYECKNSYFYIEKWSFKIMCEVCYRAKRDKKEAT